MSFMERGRSALQKLPNPIDAFRFRPGLSQLLPALHLPGVGALSIQVDISRTYSRPLSQVPPDPRSRSASAPSANHQVRALE